MHTAGQMCSKAGQERTQIKMKVSRYYAHEYDLVRPRNISEILPYRYEWVILRKTRYFAFLYRSPRRILILTRFFFV